MRKLSPLVHQDVLLEQHVSSLLGPLEPEALALLRSQLQWVELVAGETLMREGEPGDAMYLSISGRLRAYVRDDDGAEQLVREMARGQVIGEMSLYTDEPRSATVVAIRDSVLVQLSKQAFLDLLARSPQMSVAITRQMIRRLLALQTRSELARPVTIGVLPVSAGIDAAAFAEALAVELSRMGRACVLDAERLARRLEAGGAAELGAVADPEARMALLLDRIEAEHDFVLLVADPHPSEWTERAARRSDELLLLADADAPPGLHPSEQHLLARRAALGTRAEAAEILVLLHPADRRCPSGTRRWLAPRRVADHYHLRRDAPRDLARLARVLSRSAVGIVFAGGGARGLAHLGVMRALEEQGVVVDCVGGTSIGAVMAAIVASDRPLAEREAVAKRAFGVNPTGDFNLVPLMSLIRGRRLERVVREAALSLLGREPDFEDLWLPCYGVASNFSQATEQVLREGPLLKSLLASIAIPGALPPVLLDGELMCDGGTFNNFPVDVMRRQRGVAKVIGVDLAWRKPRRYEQQDFPGPWALLRDRLRPRARRRFRFPSLVAYLMNVTVLYSTSRQRLSRRLTDLYFNPPLERVGMLQWDRFDAIVQQGQEHAQQQLAALPGAELSAYRGGAAPPAGKPP